MLVKEDCKLGQIPSLPIDLGDPLSLTIDLGENCHVVALACMVADCLEPLAYKRQGPSLT